MKDLNIKNIVLFVGDAVRFDSAVDQLRQFGQTHRTIAGSLHTPASFGTMLTGRSVPNTGIKGFHNKLSQKIPCLLDITDRNCYLSSKTGTMHEDIHRIFGHERKSPIDEVEEPFIWICRDPGGHAPYNGYDPETYEQVDENAKEYLRRVAGDQETITHDYRVGVQDSISRFRDILKSIEKRGIENETLCIYTSDHGELLGEYGLLGHNHVACPELVYVPTTFVHPDIYPGVEKPIRHVDLYPTIMNAMGTEYKKNEIEGKPLHSISGNELGYNYFEMVFYGNSHLKGFNRTVHSCWDNSGGHAFVESSYIDSFAIYLGILLKSHKGRQIIASKSFKESVKKFLPGHEKYGEPNFSKKKAISHMSEIEETGVLEATEELDPDTKDRLEELGYL